MSANEYLFAGRLGREQWCELRVSSVGKLTVAHVQHLRRVLDIIEDACREEEDAKATRTVLEDRDSCVYEPMGSADRERVDQPKEGT